MVLVACFSFLNHHDGSRVKSHIGDTINGNQVIDRGKTSRGGGRKPCPAQAHRFDSFSTSASLSSLDPLSGVSDKQQFHLNAPLRTPKPSCYTVSRPARERANPVDPNVVLARSVPHGAPISLSDRQKHPRCGPSNRGTRNATGRPYRTPPAYLGACQEGR